MHGASVEPNRKWKRMKEKEIEKETEKEIETETEKETGTEKEKEKEKGIEKEMEICERARKYETALLGALTWDQNEKK